MKLQTNTCCDVFENGTPTLCSEFIHSDAFITFSAGLIREKYAQLTSELDNY
jgi:hypothetical protein